MPEIGDGKGNEAGKLPGLSEQELVLLKKVFSAPLEVPDDWITWLISRIEAQPPVLPISQIFGYSQVTPRFERVATQEALSVGQTTYADLATAGPTIGELPDGQYLLLYACNGSRDTQQTTLYYSPSINGATPSDSEAAQVDTNTQDFVTLIGATLATIESDSGINEVSMQYRQSNVGTIASFKNRWLLALRVANA